MMSEPIPDSADVIIVGAGPAGLSTARALARQGVSVVVLEARDRVGGRTLSRDIGKGRFDVGGQWLGPGQNRVAALARELGVATFPTYSQGRKMLDVGGRISTYKGSIPAMSPLKLVQLHRAIAKIDKLAKRIDPHAPGLPTQLAQDTDAISVAGWQRAMIRSRDVREVLGAGIRSIFGAEPSELSMLFFLFYVRAAGGLMPLIETENGAQQDRFVSGAQSLSLGMAEELGDRVLLSAPAQTIAQNAGEVAVTTPRGTVRGRYAVIAMPPPFASRIRYEPALPARRDLLSQRIAMGGAVKCIATYERAFWRARGFSGEVVSTGGLLTLILDNTSHDGAQPALVAFAVGRRAYQWNQLSEPEARRQILQSLARYFGPEALEPTDLVVKDWTADPWTRGCPAAYAPPGALGNFAAALRQPIGRLCFAGTETAAMWNGYIEGALESAERVTGEIITRL